MKTTHNNWFVETAVERLLGQPNTKDQQSYLSYQWTFVIQIGSNFKYCTEFVNTVRSIEPTNQWASIIQLSSNFKYFINFVNPTRSRRALINGFS